MGHVRKRQRFTLNLDEGEDEQPGTMQRSASGSGATNFGPGHESIEPEKKIMRVNPSNIIKFTHFYRNWFEIDTGLFCVPSQHSLHSMITKEMQKLLLKFKGNNTFVYVNFAIEPLKLSNFIVLSDNIKIEGGGVTEVSSFVQNSKLVHIRVRQPNIGSTYAMYVKELNDSSSRLYIPIDKLKVSSTQNAPPLIAKMKFGQDNDDYDIEQIGIYGFREQSIVGMKKVTNRATAAAGGIFDYSFATTGGKDHSELEMYKKEELIDWNVQNQLKDYDISIIDAVDCVNTYQPKYAPTLWTQKSELSADAIITNDKLPEYISAITGGGTNVLSPLVWQPMTKNFGGYIKEDSGEPTHCIKRLAGRIDNEKCHDYFTMIPIHTSTNARMKLRASVMIESSIHVSFYFRERGLIDGEDLPEIDNMNDWMEIVGNTHHEAQPNVKGITKDKGMYHFNF